MRRAVLTVAAVIALALAGTAAVRAADTLGGQLSVGGNVAVVKSLATVPVIVTLTGDYVTADPATFRLSPGESRRATLTGPARGDLVALLEPADVSGDHGAAQLVAHLAPPPVPPFDWAPLGIAMLIAIAGALAARRWRPWQWRIVRAS